MIQIVNYFGRFQTVKGRVTGLPFFARLILTIFALPGLILLGLSIVAFVVSLFALLLLTVPVYRLLSAVVSPRRVSDSTANQTPDFVSAEQASGGYASGPRRHVDVKIID